MFVLVLVAVSVAASVFVASCWLGFVGAGVGCSVAHCFAWCFVALAAVLVLALLAVFGC